MARQQQHQLQQKHQVYADVDYDALERAVDGTILDAVVVGLGLERGVASKNTHVAALVLAACGRVESHGAALVVDQHHLTCLCTVLVARDP